MASLPKLVGQHLGIGADGAQIPIGIETDRSLRAAALAAADHVVDSVSPPQASRYREQHWDV